MSMWKRILRTACPGPSPRVTRTMTSSATPSTGRFPRASRFTEAFAIRATANTGFRTPTPGQVNTLNVTTTANSAGQLVPSGTYPVDSPDRSRARIGAARTGGIRKLHGRSCVENATQDLSVTLDYYHIEIDERLALLEQYDGRSRRRAADSSRNSQCESSARQQCELLRERFRFGESRASTWRSRACSASAAAI